VADILHALIRRELTKQIANGGPQVVNRAGGGFSEQGFQLGEDLLNWVVVGTVRRQIKQLGTRVVNRFFNASNFVRAEVV
jgi:hypothetical protein